MPHSKTPGGQQASDKFMKQEAQKHGQAGPNDEQKKPGDAPVASDSGRSNVGIDNSATNQPGEKGIGGPEVSSS